MTLESAFHNRCLRWAVTTMGVKKPRAFSAGTASSALRTTPRNTHLRTRGRLLTALVMLQDIFGHRNYHLLSRLL
jgi:hypothetical protein